MTERATDRKGKKDKMTERSTPTFHVPESLSCSEIEFPILITKQKPVKWKDILEESQNNIAEVEEYKASKLVPKPKYQFINTECDYIKNEVFVHLLPALEETLNKAQLWDVMYRQRCFFNGIDWLAQVLWNNNPRHPERKIANLHLFNMKWVREYLKEHPRPYYPKSWLWPEEYAATLIQKTFRQYLVQRDEEVQEMREFWRKLKMERTLPELDVNPLLAKRFASLKVKDVYKESTK